MESVGGTFELSFMRDGASKAGPRDNGSLNINSLGADLTFLGHSPGKKEPGRVLECSGVEQIE